MERTIAVIQARMGSIRLPGKVDLKIDHSTTIERQLVVLRTRCTLVDGVVLAIPGNEENQILFDKFNGSNLCKLFPDSGDPNDVLKRIMSAGKFFKATNIVRVCADSPFIQPWAIDYAIAKHKEAKADYTFTYGMPAGMNAEVCSLTALEKIYPKTTPEEKEHVTLYFEHYPWGFKIQDLDLRNMSLDTPEDYKFLQEIAKYGLD